jgi:hypothetical protein
MLRFLVVFQILKKIFKKSVALQALTNLGPAEQLPLAVFPDCTRRYWVDILKRPNPHYFVHSSYLPKMSLPVGLPQSSGGRDSSYHQPASSSSPWFSMLTYHLGDEQYARWWPRLRDIISPHHQSINQSLELS